jgi:hypothetical protein
MENEGPGCEQDFSHRGEDPIFHGGGSAPTTAFPAPLLLAFADVHTGRYGVRVTQRPAQSTKSMPHVERHVTCQDCKLRLAANLTGPLPPDAGTPMPRHYSSASVSDGGRPLEGSDQRGAEYAWP